MATFSDSLRAGGKIRGSLEITAREATNIPIDITLHASQSAVGLRVRNSAGSTLFSIDGSGNLVVAGTTTVVDTDVTDDFTVTDTLTVAGTATFNGNVFVGNSINDLLTVNAYANFNTGAVFSGNVVVANNLTVSGNLYAFAGTEASSVVTIAGTQTLTNKTLTAPKIATGGYIADGNGNELIIFTTTAVAVNELTFANGSTGVNPKFTASGETNVGIDLQAKGTGTYRLLGTADQAAQLRLYEDTDAGTNFTAFKVGSQSGDITYTLPTALVGTGALLRDTDGSGALGWSAATSATISAAGVLCLGVATGGTDAANGVLCLSNAATAPSASVDRVHLYAYDISAGNASLGIFTETAVASDVAVASTHSLTVKVNGTAYKIPLTAV